MKKLLILLGVIILTVFGCGKAFAGPFGFRAGMKFEEIENLIGKDSVIKKEVGKYKTRKAPQSHPLFQEFYLVIDPIKGLVKIHAQSSTLSTNAYGDQLKEKFYEIKRALTNNYGNCSDEFDSLRSGSIWNEPKDFIMAMLKQERILAAFWRENLKDDIIGIGLEAKAFSRNTAILILEYEFVGFSEYLMHKKNGEQKVF